MKIKQIPKPHRLDGDLHWDITNEVSATVGRTTAMGGVVIPKAVRWAVEINGPVYICQCLPTRRACIEAIPRLLRALPDDETRQEEK